VKTANKSKWRRTPFLQVLVLLVAFLSACATTPREVYRGYSGTNLPEASLVTVELGNAVWAKFNDLHVDGANYSAVKLVPGTYRIEYSATFAVSFLVDPRMWVSKAVNAIVALEAGHTYRLRADRTTGPGYTMYFWIEDAQGNVVIGTKKP
jgi:hypothetical protein